jgi:DNA-binding transcriptional MerR regulator
MMNELLTQDELAARWRISPRTLEDWRWRGTGIPFLKIGGRVAYRREDVEDYERARLCRDTRSLRRAAGGAS